MIITNSYSAVASLEVSHKGKLVTNAMQGNKQMIFWQIVLLQYSLLINKCLKPFSIQACGGVCGLQMPT